MKISFGSIERIVKSSTGYGIRRFYGYNQNDYKYQIGDDNNNCICTFKDFCSSYICSNKKRFLHKIIFNRNNEECGEYNFFYDSSCCESNDFFEIKFPDDAELLLIGGLLDSILFYYISKPELEKSNAIIIHYGDIMKTKCAFSLNIISSILIIFLFVLLFILRNIQ